METVIIVQITMLKTMRTERLELSQGLLTRT